MLGRSPFLDAAIVQVDCSADPVYCNCSVSLFTASNKGCKYDMGPDECCVMDPLFISTALFPHSGMVPMIGVAAGIQSSLISAGTQSSFMPVWCYVG